MFRHSETEPSKVVKQSILFMNAHLGEALALEDLAGVAGYSPYHFNRVFRQTTGIPPMLYLSALRMEKGKELLLSTDATVTEVAMSIGYSSFGTFSSRFSQSVGVSPRSFRLLHSQGINAIAELKANREVLLHKRVHLGLQGKIIRPKSFEGIIFVGLFPKPIPNCRPVCGTVMTTETHYYFDKVPEGIYFILAAAFNWSDQKKTFLLPKNSLRGAADGPVFISHGVVRGYKDITLREADPTDPPILISLPILLAEKLNQAK